MSKQIRPTITVPDGRMFKGQWPQDMPQIGETPYICALAAQVKGVCEVTLPAGRADVATSTRVWEVEPIKRWRYGARQAFAYAGMSGLVPALALFGEHKTYVSDIYLEIRDRMQPLELWLWTRGSWCHVTNRREASRRIEFVELEETRPVAEIKQRYPDIAKRVAESRAAQGLPPKIEDPEVLRKVADLIIQAQRS